MDYQEAIEYINNTQGAAADGYSLKQVTKLAELMGRPDRKLRIIHIAGTNGKGSVGAYIANGLAMSGYTVGRYVSPTLLGYRERIQKISGSPFGTDEEWISREDVADWVEKLSLQSSVMESSGYGRPSAFELETVMAFCQMLRWHVDVAVIEAGMGGAFDATNIVEKPSLVVFSRISLDHTAYLGRTLREVAAQKFGIIKEGAAVTSSCQEPEIIEQLREICQRRGQRLCIADPGQIRQMSFSLEGTSFFYRGYHFELGQLGCYQPENAITACEALWQLEADGFYKINIASIQLAFRQTRWMGRFEWISRNPFLIVDGAHNPAGAAALKKSLMTYFPAQRFTYIFGVFRDKDYQGILTEMLPLAGQIFTVRAAGSRGMDSEELAEIVRERAGEYRRQIPVKSCPSIAAALQRAGRGQKIIVFGSLSFLYEVYRYFDTDRYIW